MNWNLFAKYFGRLAVTLPMAAQAQYAIDWFTIGGGGTSTRGDYAVSGTISPGIALDQEGAFDVGQNVSLSGRVYVQADAAHGSIKPGDLLTTSDTPGHAMKVTDQGRSQGAILGKAMSALEEGKGMVLVLVTLQ